MFAEVGGPLLAGMFLNINALIIAMMIAAFLIHEATAFWDVSYATTARTVAPVEQHVHSFLEMIPLVALVSVISLHWGQFLALFGGGTELRSSVSHGNPSRCLPATSHRSWRQSCCSSCCPTWKSSCGACAPMLASWFQ